MKTIVNLFCYYFLWFISSLPFCILYIFSDAIYFFVYRIAAYRRKVVRKNLMTAFPEKDEKGIKQIERSFYRWFCDYMVETLKLMTISQDEIQQRIVFKGTDVMDRYINKGVSCAILLGHYCNWEWISTISLAVSSKAVCAELYHPLENFWLNQWFLDIRQRFGSVCIPMNESLRHIVRYQYAGYPLVVGYIADQKPNWKNIHLWLNFLNHSTPVFTGSERIIKRTRQVVFYGDVRRIRRGYYECDLKLIEEHPESLSDYQLTERYMQELEKTIQRAPAYWLWSHDRWSRTKEEFDIRFYIKDGKVFEKMTEEEYAQTKGWKSYWHR